MHVVVHCVVRSLKTKLIRVQVLSEVIESGPEQRVAQLVVRDHLVVGSFVIVLVTGLVLFTGVEVLEVELVSLGVQPTPVVHQDLSFILVQQVHSVLSVLEFS